MITLVLLPGMDGTGDLFAPFVAALGPDQSVVVVRYPTDEALGYAELEAIARAALPVDRPFVLLGESFSGPIAISLAASQPSLLMGLVLCCSFARSPQPVLSPFRALVGTLPLAAVPAVLLEALLLSRFGTSALRSAFRAAVAKVSAVAMRARVRAVLTVDVSAKLASVAAPVLYLRAARDRVVPASASHLIVRLKPDTRVVELEAPHFLLQAVPSAAALEIKAFARAL
jgi:pimeloyl-ACP methyl ester carboxylesterase